MPKRFADTRLFSESWFLDLSIESKMMWLYLERSCDHAGIWDIDIPRMQRDIGSRELSLVKFIDEVNRDYSKLSGEPEAVNRIMLIHNNTKLWMTGFISEQWEKGSSGINISVAAIRSAVNRLKDEGILEFALKEGVIRIQGQIEKHTEMDNHTEPVENNEPAQFTEMEDKYLNNLPQYCYEGKLSIKSLTAAYERSVSALINTEPCLFDGDNYKPFGTLKDKDKDKDSGSSCLKGKGGAGGKTISAAVIQEIQPEEESPGSALLTESANEAQLNGPDIEIDVSDSQVRMLFHCHWGKEDCTKHEKSFASALINDYGFEEVKHAFGEAANHNKHSLAYVKGILQKRRTKFELQKAEEAKRAERFRNSAKVRTEQQQGVKLNLIESVYGIR